MRKSIYISFVFIFFFTESAFGQRGSVITDQIRLFDLGLSMTTYYTVSQIDGLSETLIREEFFLPDSYNFKTNRRNGGGVAFSIPIQWQKNLYSQGGVMYEWQNANSSSDFRFNNITDPEKSFDLWLNYKYFGFNIESGVSFPFPFKWNKGIKGLMFKGLTFNTGIGMKYSTPVGNEFVVFKSSQELNTNDLKVQEDLRGLLTPSSSKLNLYWVNRIGYKFAFIEFILESSNKDALKSVEENIYNFKENDNRRTNLLMGIGVRYSFHSNHKAI